MYMLNMVKKKLSLVLAFAVLMCTVQLGIYVSAETYFSNGDGTAQNPYQISSVDDLKKLAKLINSGNTSEYNGTNVYYKLTSDLDLNPGYSFDYQSDSKRVKISKGSTVVCYVGTGNETGKYYADATTKTELTVTTTDDSVTINNNKLNLWTPIGMDNHFISNFDGGNHTISGMFVNLSSTTDNVFAGLFWNAVSDNSNNLLSNIKLINGYVGSSTSGNGKKAAAGGIVGFSAYSTISNCSSNITISASSSSDEAYAGGIVGGSECFITINNCNNSGVISSASSNPNKQSYAGGIVSYTENSTINNSTNSGTISSISDNEAFAGGILGRIGYSTINSSTNSGKITATGKSTFIGGISGQIEISTINNSNNSGAISSNNDNTNAGGIAGWLLESTMNSCKNSGAIVTTSTEAALVGGLAANVNNSTIKTSYNSGPINSTSENDISAGGIAAQFAESKLSGSGNSGAVDATTNNGMAVAGGLVGYFGDSTLSISSNSGSVNAISKNVDAHVGGIIGFIDSLGGSIINKLEYSYSASDKLNASGKTSSIAGGIIGSILSGVSAEIKDSYYDIKAKGVTKAISSGTPAAGSKYAGKSTAEMQGTALRTGATGEGWTDENWNFRANQYPFVNWGKATAYTIPTGITGEYGMTLRTAIFPADSNGTWQWKNPDTPIKGKVGETYEYDAIFTPADGRYKAVECKVAVKVVHSSLPTGDSTNYLVFGSSAVILIASCGLIFVLRRKNKA